MCNIKRSSCNTVTAIHLHNRPNGKHRETFQAYNNYSCSIGTACHSCSLIKSCLCIFTFIQCVPAVAFACIFIYRRVLAFPNPETTTAKKGKSSSISHILPSLSHLYLQEVFAFPDETTTAKEQKNIYLVYDIFIYRRGFALPEPVTTVDEATYTYTLGGRIWNWWFKFAFSYNVITGPRLKLVESLD